MHRNDEGGMVLTDAELEALAYFIASRAVSDLVDDEHLTWEDVPQLCESQWEQLAGVEVPAIARLLSYRALNTPGVDAAHIHRELM